MRLPLVRSVMLLCMMTPFMFHHDVFADTSVQPSDPLENNHLSLSALPESLQEVVSKALEKEDGAAYDFQMQGNQALVNNHRQNFNAKFNGEGMSLQTFGSLGDFHLNMTLVGMGWQDQVKAIGSGHLKIDKNRLEIVRPDVVEWFVNREKGLEQGFTIDQAPEGDGRHLVLKMAIESDLQSATNGNQKGIELTSNQNTVLRYDGLLVVDASGKKIPATLSSHHNDWEITVDTLGAQFPIIVDPVIAAGHKLIADDGENGDSFGVSVDIDGDTALIGSYRHKDSGAAYIFKRDGNRWLQKSKLISDDPDRGDLFGISVALEGDTAVIGASGDDRAGDRAGAAYVFVRRGNTWVQEDKLFANDARRGDAFGGAVDISGHTVLIGASQRDDIGGAISGAAYVFVRDANRWVQQAKLLASDADVGDTFGNAVALDGDTALVGAFRTDDDIFITEVGTAYIFDRIGQNWFQRQILTASDGGDLDFFGVSVALEKDMAVVGAFRNDAVAINSGSAYVFMKNGASWVEQAKLTASDGDVDDQFGNVVAISNGLILVGASVDDDLGDDSGAVYVFDRADNGSWFEQLKLLPVDGGPGHRFGASLASDGLRMITGALRADGNDLTDGAAYIFRMFFPR